MYSDEAFSRELDAAGRVIKITDWAGVQYTIGYNANGDMDSVTMSNGLSYTTQYDGSRAVKKEWINSAGQVIAAFESTHDSSGILSSDTKTVDANTDQRSFSWGDSGQLTGVNGNSVGWNGKRVTSTPQLKALSYNPTSGRLDSVTRVDDSVVSFDYDLFGNRIAKNEGGTSTHYSWNSLNQLTGVDDTTYSYGADGMRSSINGKQQMYGQDLKLMSDGENKYLWGVDGSLLTQAPLGSVDEAESLHALTDKMGSVYGMVKSELVPGTVDQHEFVLKAQYSYSAFGERNLVSGNDVTVMGFVSEQHDDTGFIYLRARYYDPSTAQFISLDPMVSMTLDPYGYANGNPLQIIDPLGLWGWNPMDWTADEWGTVGTWAGRIGAFAAVATVTFASGGTALIIAGAISGVATGVSTSVGVSQTTQSCRQGITTKCVTQAGTTALGMVPLLKPVKALRVKANSEINWNESSVPSPQAHNARRFNQKIGYSAISSSSSIVGTINSAVAGC